MSRNPYNPHLQAALRCKDPVFWAFLEERGWRTGSVSGKIEDEETAAKVVRAICEIESRRDLADDLNAQAIWHDLDNLYQAWAGQGTMSPREKLL